METHEYHELIASIDELKRRVSALESSDVPVRTTTKRPSLEEVRVYALQIDLCADQADNFYNHYESNGWKVGKNPMKSWRAALSNWKRTWKEGVFRSNGNGNASVFGLKAALEAKERQARELSNRDYYPDQHQWSNEASRQQFIVLKRDIKSLTARIAQSV